MFHNCWNKTAASQIFPVDFIFYFFSDDYKKIVIILMYLTNYSEKNSMDDRVKDLLGEDILWNLVF